MDNRTIIATAKRLNTVREALQAIDENLELAVGQLKYVERHRNTSSFAQSDLTDIEKEIQKPVKDLWFDLHTRLEQLNAEVAKTRSEPPYELEKPTVLSEAEEILDGA